MTGINMIFDVRADPLLKKFDAMRRGSRRALIDAMDDLITTHNRRWAKRFRSYPGPRSAMESPHPVGRLYARSGALIRGYRRFPAVTSGDTLRAKAVLVARQALVQEKGTKGLPGGAIRPKRGKYLTVPLPEALTPSGRPRFGPKLIKGSSGYTTSTGLKTELRISSGGNPIIWAQFGETWKPIYVLRTKVSFPGRLGFFKTWKDMKKFRELRLQKAMKIIVRKK